MIQVESKIFSWDTHRIRALSNNPLPQFPIQTGLEDGGGDSYASHLANATEELSKACPDRHLLVCVVRQNQSVNIPDTARGKRGTNQVGGRGAQLRINEVGPVSNDRKRGMRKHALSIVWSTTAFPNPRGTYTITTHIDIQPCSNAQEKAARTMLNQLIQNPESTLSLYIAIAPMKGKIPSVTLRSL